MKIPGFIRGAANRGNKVAQAFVQQYDNGDDTPYNPQAYEAIKQQFSGEDNYMSDDFESEMEEENLSPEEQRATDKIEEYGEKYKTVKNDNDISDEELYEELGDNEYIYANLNKEQAAQVLSERKGIDLDRASDYIEKNFNEHFWDEEMFSEPNARPNETKLHDMNLSDSDMWNMAYQYIGKDKLDKLAEQLDLESSQDIPTNELIKYMSDEDIADMMRLNGLDEEDYDEDLSPMEESLFDYEPEPLTDEEKELVKKHFEDKELAKGNPYDPEDLPDEGLSQEELDKSEKQSNWYDNLTDDNEHAKAYKEDALKVNPERAALIAQAMDEYVAEKPQRGFITEDQLKRYGEKLGLPQMSDRDLRLMWGDVHNVGSYKGYGTPYDKGGRELEDAHSAFTEVVNQEARNRKAKGNYFPYDEEDIEEAKGKIADIARPYEGYDADSYKGYMTTEDLDKVERIANAYHITDEDLEKLSRMFSKYNYPGRGWKGNK